MELAEKRPRSCPAVQRKPRDYSLSVHGCDHTRAEFGSSDRQRLYWKAQQALERMNRHESITGISHDPVMVFPQGIFSEAAMDVLKRTGLIASVNNDVISADPHPRAHHSLRCMGHRSHALQTFRSLPGDIHGKGSKTLLSTLCWETRDSR